MRNIVVVSFIAFRSALIFYSYHKYIGICIYLLMLVVGAFGGCLVPAYRAAMIWRTIQERMVHEEL